MRHQTPRRRRVANTLGLCLVLAILVSSWSFQPATAPDEVLAQEQPAGPELSRPANGATTTDTTPSFTWSRVSGVKSFTFELASDPTFATVIARNEANRRSYTVTTPLEPGQFFYWHVGAVDATGATSWSSTWSFSIPAKPTPTATRTPRTSQKPQTSPTATRTPRASPTRKPNPTKTPTRTPTALPRPASGLSGTLQPAGGFPISGGGRSINSDSPGAIVDRKLGTIWLAPPAAPRRRTSTSS